MLGNRLTYLSPLIYIIFTSLTFAQVSLSVKNVSLTGSNTCTNNSLTTEGACEAPGTCSDATKTTKTTCEADGACSVDTGSCSNSVYSTQLNCGAPGTCSDVTKTTKATCEQASGTWTSTYTWTLTYPDKASCEPANTWTTTNTWTQTNIWGKDGALDVQMINKAVCSYCTDNTYNEQDKCEQYGSDPSTAATILDAAWELSTTIDSATCVAWDAQTKTGKHGVYFDGKVAGYQFQLFGVTVTSASGGTTGSNGGFQLTAQAQNYNSTTKTHLPNIIVYSLTGAYIEPSDADGEVLVQVTFTDYDGDDICFGEYTGSLGANVVSTKSGIDAGDSFGDCFCGSTTDQYLDCAGTCGGSAALGGCDNKCNSTAVVDDCNVCGGLNASKDCAGECGGNGKVNTAGDGACCATGNIDCANACDGSSIEDNCDVCDADNTNNCVKDCAGAWGGSAVDTDSDGVCDDDDECADTAASANVDADGCSGDQLSISKIGEAIPNTFSISQNFPNPFNPVTSIAFDLAEIDEISLVVYDLTGKEIATLVSGVYTPGRYMVEWNALNNAGKEIVSGMYIYRYISSNNAITRKMLYLK